MGVLQVKVVQISAQIFRFEQEEASEELGNLGSLIDRNELFCDFVQDAQMRIIGPLYEAVEQNDHFVQFKCVFGHNLHQFVQAVLEEEKFSALRVRIQKLIGNQTESFDHQSQQIVILNVLFVVARAFTHHHRVHLFQSFGEKGQ